MFPKTIFHFDIGRCVRMAQAEKQISNVELGRLAGVNSVRVSHWRKAEDMRISRINQLCEIFGMTREEFLAGGKDRAQKEEAEVTPPAEAEVTEYGSGPFARRI